MSYQIIQQPNKMYAIWSTNSDTFVSVCLNKQQVRNFFVAIAREHAIQRTNDIFDKFEAGELPYYQFTMSYEDAIKTIKDKHGPNACILTLLGEI